MPRRLGGGTLLGLPLPLGVPFPNNIPMAYDDRDYYREPRRLEFTGAVGRGTMTLLIVISAGYFMGAVLSNTLTYHDAGWLSQARHGEGMAAWFYRLFVLTSGNLAPWAATFEPQPWKLLTSWVVSHSLVDLVFTLIGAFIVGRAMEQLLGWRWLLLSAVGLSACSAALAGLADALLLGSRQSVIMGLNAALLGLFTPLIWLYPKEQKILSFPARSFIVVLLVALVSFGLVISLATPDEVVASPTQPMFAVLVSAGVCAWLQRRGVLTRLSGIPEDDRASWGRPMYRADESRVDEKESFFAARPPEDEEARREAEERKQVDALLEKISREGISSLSRAERQFLDGQSRKLKK